MSRVQIPSGPSIFPDKSLTPPLGHRYGPTAVSIDDHLHGGRSGTDGAVGVDGVGHREGGAPVPLDRTGVDHSIAAGDGRVVVDLQRGEKHHTF